MDSSGIPAVNCGGYGIHAVDSLHEGGGDSSGEEINEGVFVGDFTEGDVVFELGDEISEWEVFCDRSGGGEPCNSFIFDINVDQ